jgi:thiol-disulfide isomerase/thioredoxin
MMVFGYFPESDTFELETFRELTNKIADIGFAYTSDGQILHALFPEIDSRISSISLIKRDDAKFALSDRYEGDLKDIQAIVTFIKRYRLPRIVDITNDPFSIPALLSSRSPILLIVLGENPPPMELDMIAGSIRERQGVLAIVRLGSKPFKKNVERFLSFVGVSGTASALWLLTSLGEYSSNRFQRFTAPLSVPASEAVKTFISDIESNKLEEFRRSTANRDQQTGIVQLTGSTFESFISSEQPTVVMHYAAWCSYCVEMYDVFEEVSKFGRVKLGVLDASTDDVPIQFREQDFPKIVLYTRGVRLDTYTGDQNSEDIVRWISGLVQ